MKELTTKGKFDERSIEKVREFMAEEASTLRSQIRAYELIYDFLGLEPPDEGKVRRTRIYRLIFATYSRSYKQDHIGGAEISEKGDVSGVPAMLEGRVRDMNLKDIMERKSGKAENRKSSLKNWACILYSSYSSVCCRCPACFPQSTTFPTEIPAMYLYSNVRINPHSMIFFGFEMMASN